MNLKSTKLKRRTVSVIFTVIFLALLVVVNVIFSVLTERYPSMNIDITPEKLNTLSEDAVTVAQNAVKDTTIYIIGNEDNIRGDKLFASYQIKYSQVANLADRLAEANPDKISVKFIDPDKNPSFISEYADDNLISGKVLIHTEDRYRVLSIADLFDAQQDPNTGAVTYYTKVDSALANAIYLVNLENVPVIAYATGHGEMFSGNTRANFDALMTDNCYELKSFDMFNEDIPEDASVVVIGTPATDYTDVEIEKLNNFLKEEGRENSRSVFATTYCSQTELPNLTAFLEDWGLAVETGMVVVETDSSRRLSTDNSFIFVDTETDVLTGSYSNLLAAVATPVKINFDTSNSIVTHTLIKSSDSCALLEGTDSSSTDASSQITQSYTIAALAQKSNTDSTGTKIKRTNVVVYGDTYSLASYVNNATFGNKQYILDLFAYLTDTTDKGNGLTINQTQTSIQDITASAQTIRNWGLFVFTIGIPVAILVLGIVVFIRRRHL